MDEDLKIFLGQMESRLRESNESVVTRAIEASETRLRTDLGERIDAVESRMREHVETVETRLLSTFWQWAKTADARYRQHYAQVNGVNERLAIVEDRLSELERGKDTAA